MVDQYAYVPLIGYIFSHLLRHRSALFEGRRSIPYSLDITIGSSLVFNHRTSDVQVMSDGPGTP